MPPATRRIMPARTISLWLTISASAGASFRVPIKKREAFIQNFPKAAAQSEPSKKDKAGIRGPPMTLEPTRWRDARRPGRSARSDPEDYLDDALLRRIVPFWCDPVRQVRYLFIIKAILKDSKVVVCWIVKAFARTSASSS